MQIAIIALGSRGDVQPYVALGKGLLAAGHAVRLVTHMDYEALAASHRLEFWPVRGNVQDVVESEEMRKLLEKGNFIAISRYTAREATRAAIDWAKDGLEACRGADLILSGIGGLFIGLALAEKLAIPFVQAYLVPLTPTRAFPGVLLPQTLPLSLAAANRASHHLVRQVMWQSSRASDQAVRRQVLGLPPSPFWGPFRSELLHRYPILYGFSPAVIPRPLDWGENTHVTGYWFLDERPDWVPPQALTAFLRGGPAPVYVGFGSMGSRKPEETADLVLGALARTGQRAIMLSGWGGLRKEELPETVFMADAVPHSWLFPRMAAVVHHGGAGTTAAGLRAGVPSVITPFFGDQPFWGRRVADLGVGPRPIPRQKLTTDLLAFAIERALTDRSMRERAAELGERIRAEDGVARAVEVVERLKMPLRKKGNGAHLWACTTNQDGALS